MMYGDDRRERERESETRRSPLSLGARSCWRTKIIGKEREINQENIFLDIYRRMFAPSHVII